MTGKSQRKSGKNGEKWRFPMVNREIPGLIFVYLRRIVVASLFTEVHKTYDEE